MHGSEDEVASAGLQACMCLLADQDLADGALGANTGCLVDRWANQRELRLSFSNDSSNYLTCVNTDLHSELLLVA